MITQHNMMTISRIIMRILKKSDTIVERAKEDFENAYCIL